MNDGVDARAIDVAVQLREGASEIQTDPFGERDDRAFLAPAVHLRLGKLEELALQDLVTAERPCHDQVAHAVRQASLGDDGPLAWIVEHCGVSMPPDLALAVLARVGRQREQLIAALRSFVPGRLAYNLPFDLLSSVSIARDIARTAGDARAAARWQAIVDRHAQALADRDRVIALVLIHAM